MHTGLNAVFTAACAQRGMSAADFARSRGHKSIVDALTTATLRSHGRPLDAARVARPAAGHQLRPPPEVLPAPGDDCADESPDVAPRERARKRHRALA
jgi:hypothetical protein